MWFPTDALWQIPSPISKDFVDPKGYSHHQLFQKEMHSKEIRTDNSVLRLAWQGESIWHLFLLCRSLLAAKDTSVRRLAQGYSVWVEGYIPSILMHIGPRHPVKTAPAWRALKAAESIGSWNKTVLHWNDFLSFEFSPELWVLLKTATCLSCAEQ